MEARLFDRKVVHKVALRRDRPLRKSRNTIRPGSADLLDTEVTVRHVNGGQTKRNLPVPMHGDRLMSFVDDLDRNIIILVPDQMRSRSLPVDEP